MAIYHLSAKVISRGKGQSAVASASYRSGEKLLDEQTGEIKFYKRDVQPDSMILAPEHSPEWVQDRQQLWNEVERAETRKNSQLAREITVALPVELKSDEQKDLIRNYIQEEFINRGMVADIAIHRDDSNNPHAHVMLTTREISEEGFTKKNRDWNDRNLIQEWREKWAEHTNEALEQVGVQQKITHLSHEARGLETLPSKHEGHVVREMEKRGHQTEIGEYNRLVKMYNETVVDLNTYREARNNILEQDEKQTAPLSNAQNEQKETILSQSDLKALNEAKDILKGDKVTFSSINKRLEQIDRWEKSVRTKQKEFHTKEPIVRVLSGDLKNLQHAQSDLKVKEKALENLPVNPFKRKEAKKEITEEIGEIKNRIRYIESRIEPQFKELSIQTTSEFVALQTKLNGFHKEVIQGNPIKAINYQRDKLIEAQEVLGKPYVEQLKQQYPNEKVMDYLKPEIAKDLAKLNDCAKSIAPIKVFDQVVKHFETHAEQTQEPRDQQMAGILGNILTGLQQAQQQMNKDNRQKALSPKKRKQKQKYKESELEL